MPLYTVPTTAVYRAPDGDTRQFAAGTRIDMADAVDFGMPGAVLVPADAGGAQFADHVDVVPVSAGNFASFAPGQNVAFYTRFRVAAPITVAKLKYLVGGTQNGNVDGGIFLYGAGTVSLLASSGATPQGAINAVQTLALPPTALGPGTDYAAALVSDSATGTFARVLGNATALVADAMVTTKVGQFPLATTPTPNSANASLLFLRLAP